MESEYATLGDALKGLLEFEREYGITLAKEVRKRNKELYDAIKGFRPAIAERLGIDSEEVRWEHFEKLAGFAYGKAKYRNLDEAVAGLKKFCIKNPPSTGVVADKDRALYRAFQRFKPEIAKKSGIGPGEMRWEHFVELAGKKKVRRGRKPHYGTLEEALKGLRRFGRKHGTTSSKKVLWKEQTLRAAFLRLKPEIAQRCSITPSEVKWRHFVDLAMGRERTAMAVRVIKAAIGRKPAKVKV